MTFLLTDSMSLISKIQVGCITTKFQATKGHFVSVYTPGHYGGGEISGVAEPLDDLISTPVDNTAKIGLELGEK